jgi:hypothetical protein
MGLDSINRLWICENNHQAISYLSVEKEACPLCEAKRLHECLEKECYSFCESTQFYKNIVRKIGSLFGEAARTSDDGSLQEDVLALKVYPLVYRLVKSRRVIIRSHSHRNPRVRRRSVSPAATALLGACAGFIAGLWKRNTK